MNLSKSSYIDVLLINKKALSVFLAHVEMDGNLITDVFSSRFSFRSDNLQVSYRGQV